MKKLCCLLLLVPFFAMAQKEITHTVGPKESLSSIGRLYNVNGRELANYNKIDYNKGLSIGQVLKIPKSAGTPTVTPPVVTKTPEVKKAPEVKKETAVVKEPEVKKEMATEKNGTPIYHTVAKKETLYHISTLYNKVPIADIKKWNHLTSDALNEGAQLIVGYTKTTAAPVVKKEETKADDANKKAIKKAEEDAKKTADDVSEKTKHQVDKVIEKESPPLPVKNTEVVTAPVATTKSGGDFKGGVFKNLFDEQAKGRQTVTESGTGGVFKSTSGWEDGKYYCLHNNAPAGTILKITNNATGKSVYAKVLDLITDIKQNNGLIIRLSNAAADALGVADTKLDCTINYSK